MSKSRHDGYVLKNDEGVQINFSVTKMVLDVSGERSDDVYILIELAIRQTSGLRSTLIPEQLKHITGWMANT